jgi:hypothetical protein
VANVGGVPVVQIDEGFDRAWRRVGLALDRTGFTVEDRDRSQGLYFVRYVAPKGDKKEPGFLGKLFELCLVGKGRATAQVPHCGAQPGRGHHRVRAQRRWRARIIGQRRKHRARAGGRPEVKHPPCILKSSMFRIRKWEVVHSPNPPLEALHSRTQHKAWTANRLQKARTVAGWQCKPIEGEH